VDAPSLQRRPERLERDEYDVAVVGAGIYGAWVALDAAQRGLRVALVEQDDFGHGNSANSQRIVHGGLRYLQHADFRRSRESIRERSTLLRIAPHLIRPMPFVVPTYGHGVRSAAVMGGAIILNELISFDRNRGLPASRRLPRGRRLSRATCLDLYSGFDPEGLTGGALFYDAQVQNSERLCLSILRSARAAGVELANYVRVTGFLRDGNAIVGVSALDRIAQRTLEIRARLVISCAGAWTAQTLEMAADQGMATRRRREFEVFKAFVLVTRPIVDRVGVALAAKRHKGGSTAKGYRNLFVTPWHGHSMLGTFYAPFAGHPDQVSVEPDEIRRCVAEFREVCPSVPLEAADVSHVFAGLVPRDPRSHSAEMQDAKQYRIVDHAKEDGIDGYLTVLGVKWTTARDVAQRTVDRTLHKLGREAAPCETHLHPLHGGDMNDPDAFLASERRDKPGALSDESLRHLIDNYGSAYREVLELARSEPNLMEPLVPGRPEIRAQAIHAVRVEMAQTLDDVVFRRLPIGSVGLPDRASIEACAAISAGELGWDANETECQIARLKTAGVCHAGVISDA
jgi:glycerol-3-phosphate dehydrogenase